MESKLLRCVALCSNHFCSFSHVIVDHLRAIRQVYHDAHIIIRTIILSIFR
nr:MAG TPA: hypothetical protein [Caudoviricetes sp.]